MRYSYDGEGRLITAVSPAGHITRLDWEARMQKEQPHRFGGKVVGHVPDACAGGKSKGGRAMALDRSVNSYIGATFAGNTSPGDAYSNVEILRELP